MPIGRLHDGARITLAPDIGQGQHPEVRDQAVLPRVHAGGADHAVAIETTENGTVIEFDIGVLQILL